MLKLEKISKTLDISISLRQRDRILNRNLLQALAIALGLHLAALVIFPVALTKFSGSQQVLPPVSVAAILPHLTDSDVSAEIEDEEISPRYLPAPNSRMPTLTLIPPSTVAPIAMTERQENFPSFAALEEEERHPLHDFLDPQPHFDQPVTVLVSGPLGRHKRVDSPCNLADLPSGMFRVVFRVMMENRSGTIFWFERKEGTNENVNRFAENLLQNINFELVQEVAQQAFVTEGEVEIILSKMAST